MAHTYSDRHRMLIQAMLSKPVSSEEDMLDLYKVITGNDSTSKNSHLASLVKEVNSEVKKYHMEIKKQICEITGTKYYALVSQFQSPEEAFEKLIQTYSPNEREYFRLLVEEIVASEERCLLRHGALNMSVASSSQASQNIGPIANSGFLERFIEDGWLVIHENGRLYLAARAIAELEHVLLRMYSVESCNLCDRVCVVGLRCVRDTCGTVAHSHCLQTYGAKRANNNVCPKCGTVMQKHV